MRLHQPCTVAQRGALLTCPQDASAHLLPHSAAMFSTKLKQKNRKPTRHRFLCSPAPVIIKFYIPQFTLFCPWTWWCSGFSCNDQHWGIPCSLLLLLPLGCSAVTRPVAEPVWASVPRAASAHLPPCPTNFLKSLPTKGSATGFQVNSEYLYIVYLNSVS